MSDKTKSVPLHRVDIHSARGKDVICTNVPEHEIDVLRAIHGADNVIDSGEIDEEAQLPESAAGELLRMQTKYRQPGHGDPVRFAFPNGATSLVALGFTKGGDAAKPVQSMQRNHKATAKKDAATKADAAKKDAADKA